MHPPFRDSELLMCCSMWCSVNTIMATEKRDLNDFGFHWTWIKSIVRKTIWSLDPDLKVIVADCWRGGVLCVFLSLSSEYFNTVLSSAMKEGETKVSDISNEDPSDWRELFPFFNACVGGTNKQANALSTWLCELCYPDFPNSAWQRQCDNKIKACIKMIEKALNKRWPWCMLQSNGDTTSLVAKYARRVSVES
jgi:hypothetical protein